jgi:hypothetical protein
MEGIDRGGGAEEAYRRILIKVQPDAYRLSSAKEKLDILWEAISESPYETLPALSFSLTASIRRLVDLPWLRKAFEAGLDVRPPRTKAFHPLGTVAKIEFVADGLHDFTGLFSTGAVGLARLSLALNESAYAPSAAFKLCVDGQPSLSLLLDQSIDQQSSRDFFERAPTNITLWPELFPLKAVWWLVDFWLSDIAPVMHQPLDSLAEVTATGQKVTTPRAPYQIHLYAPAEVHFPPDAKEDFRILLMKIPPGTVLYRVFGRAAKGDDRQVYLGYVRTSSKFVASEFGDRILALPHNPTPGYQGRKSAKEFRDQ